MALGSPRTLWTSRVPCHSPEWSYISAVTQKLPHQPPNSLLGHLCSFMSLIVPSLQEKPRISLAAAPCSVSHMKIQYHRHHQYCAYLAWKEKLSQACTLTGCRLIENHFSKHLLLYLFSMKYGFYTKIAFPQQKSNSKIVQGFSLWKTYICFSLQQIAFLAPTPLSCPFKFQQSKTSASCKTSAT